MPSDLEVKIVKEKVLIVDDEKSIVDVLSYALIKEGFCIEKAYDGRDALHKINSFKPDILILDIMLPELNGFDICRKISFENMGILMLTAKNDIVDKVLGLELGADDYLTKPFDIREVIARVNSLARRFRKTSTQNDNREMIVIDGLIINCSERIVSIEGSNIDFTAKEFELLKLLLSSPKRIYTREDLLSIIWNMEYFGGTRTVDTHIQKIRKKLGEKYQSLIFTVHGIGYKGVVNLNESGN
jgi:two-component system alkaline phosphatase synthesis response regulator PhoP